ncbi:exonuclease domain-containing protein [Tessaracoccus lapidicaptus]|uniref:exonuclease domain-containing protein n=1 Tax=Tessaracoccus lapidicaptus TaxID=1427523 RepID=UPI003342869A
MSWWRPTNPRLADRVPDGGLRRFLAAAPPPRGTPVRELPLLAVDLETTGLSPETDHILEVGMVDVDGLGIPLATATALVVDPGSEVGQSATIHRITDDDLAAGVPLPEALDRLFDRLAGRVLLAHHAAVEVGFLTEAVRRVHGVRIDLPAVDTLTLGHRALGFDEDLPRDALRLWRLRARAGLPSYRGHDAMIDALGCAELYLALVAELAPRDLGQLRRLS